MSAIPGRCSTAPDTSAPPAIIAVDLGNSAAKWAIAGQSGNRLSLRSGGWAERLIEEVSAATLGRPAGWRIASVNRPITKTLIGRLAELEPRSSVRILSSGDIPLVARVGNPDRVGIDRLLAAWMASQLNPRHPSIIVDAGSAITVDVVNREAEYLGGVILPGVGLQFDSLARGTDALPSIELPHASEISNAPLAIPATDTESAIRSGILLGTASAIDGLISHSLKRLGEGVPTIFFTGGDAPLLSRLSSHDHQVIPALVLDAILALPALAAESKAMAARTML